MRRLWASGAGPRLAVFTGPGALLIWAGVAASAGWLATASFQQDFAAYYTAGAAVARGLDPYVNYLPQPDRPWDGVAIFRHSRFLYPPLMAHLFRPWAALPYQWAKVLFTAASVGALVSAFRLLLIPRPPVAAARAVTDRRDAKRVRAWARWRAPVLCALWVPVLLTLERGQIDLFELAILAAAWRWRRLPLVAGPLLAAAMLGKPLLLGVWPLLLAARKYQWAAATFAAALLLALLNVVVAGPTVALAYARNVLPRAARYGEGGPPTMLLSEAECTRGIVARYGGDAAHDAGHDDRIDGATRINGRGRPFAEEIGTFARGASLSRWLSGGEAPPSLALCLIVFAALGGILAWGARRTPDNAAWYWGGAVATIVAAPVSWAMDLVWTLPLFHGAAALMAPAVPKRARAWAWPLASAWAFGMVGPLFQPAWILAALLAVAAAAISTTCGGAPT